MFRFAFKKSTKVAIGSEFHPCVEGMADSFFRTGLFKDLGDVAADRLNAHIFFLKVSVNPGGLEIGEAGQVDTLLTFTRQEAPDFFSGE